MGSPVRSLLDSVRSLIGAGSAKPGTASAARTASGGSGLSNGAGVDHPSDDMDGPVDGSLDDPRRSNNGFVAAEVATIRRVELRIRHGMLDVPQLSSTAVTLLEILNRPTAEMTEIADVFATDPALSGELLSAANSISAGSRMGMTTIKACVVRVGMRSLRGMILAASMRGHLFNGRVANELAEMVWRQALSVAAISRKIAPHVGEDADLAFTVGLLHDIGKMPLLSMMADEAGERDIDRALVGLLFVRLHEMAGRAVARDWRLGNQLISVCGQHHNFEGNKQYPRLAALAVLAHQLDLALSLGDDEGFEEIVESDAMGVLVSTTGERKAVLAAAREAYLPAAVSKAAA